MINIKSKLKNFIILLTVAALVFSLQFTAAATTSFSFRFDEKHERLLNDYPDYAANVNESLSMTPMPGVEKTQMYDGSYCYNMVPQGFCFAGDYMLITAYDYEKEFNSVIYVISNDDVYNRKLLTVIETQDKNHVGGITCDGEYVYIARSEKEELGVLKLSDISNATANSVAKLDYHTLLSCGCTASSVSYHDGRLWVGKFEKWTYSKLYGFSVNKTADGLSLEQTDKLYTPSKTQGVAFFDAENKTYLAVSSSYGRNNKSRLRIFEIEQRDGTLSKRFVTQLVMPPLAEEIDTYDGFLYLTSEGAATEYTSTDCRNTDAPLDRVAAIPTDRLISEEAKSGFFTSACNHISTFVSELILNA